METRSIRARCCCYETSRSTSLIRPGVRRCFVEPVVPGNERVNLAEVGRSQRRDSRTTVRDTLPPPPARSGVKLGRPTSIPDDTTMVPRRESTRRPGAHDGSTTSPLEDLVTAPLPVAAETAAMQAAQCGFQSQ